MPAIVLLLVVLGLIWLFSKRSAVKATAQGLQELSRLAKAAEDAAASAKAGFADTAERNEAALVLSHLYAQVQTGKITQFELMAMMWIKYPAFMAAVPEPDDPAKRAEWRRVRQAMGY